MYIRLQFLLSHSDLLHQRFAVGIWDFLGLGDKESQYPSPEWVSLYRDVYLQWGSAKCGGGHLVFYPEDSANSQLRADICHADCGHHHYTTYCICAQGRYQPSLINISSMPDSGCKLIGWFVDIICIVHVLMSTFVPWASLSCFDRLVTLVSIVTKRVTGQLGGNPLLPAARFQY